MRNGILAMVAWDLEPFSVVKHRGFRYYTKKAEQRFKMPSQGTVVNLVKTRYKIEYDRVEDEIQNDVKKGKHYIKYHYCNYD